MGFNIIKNYTMSLNWSYNIYLKKETAIPFWKDLVLNYTDRDISCNQFDIENLTEKNILKNEFPISLYVKLTDELKNLLEKNKITSKVFIDTKGEFCNIGWIYVTAKALDFNNIIYFKFNAASREISEIIYNNSIEKIFITLCKKYNAVLCFFDFELALTILYANNKQQYKHISEEELGERPDNEEELFNFLINKIEE